MAEYRNRETGDIKTQGQWRAEHPNTSFPRVWGQDTLDFLKLDPVLEAPKPTPGQYQSVRRDGAVQDAKGNWIIAWAVVDMFSDYTDEEGVLHTKTEQEAAYQAGLDEKKADSVRSTRNTLLSETDWMALSDNTMTPEWATYRQALRDITDHANFPWLDDADWPTKPE